MNRPRRHTSRDAGFTLVEVMVAVAIIATLAVAALVALPSGPPPARAEADALALRLNAARVRAVTSGEIIGFSADADGSGYIFMAYGPDGWAVMHGDRSLAPRALAGGVSLARADQPPLWSARTAEAAAPQVWFDPAGAAPSAAWRVTGRDGTVTVAADGRGGFEVRP
jgi:type II secretion system protein H